MTFVNIFEKAFNSIIPELRNKGLDDRSIQEVRTKVEMEMENVEPPKIAIIGFTGVGKSSTINALFNAGIEISDVRACTKEVAEVYGDITPYLKPGSSNISEYRGSRGNVIVYDMPGLGEDVDADQIYSEMYRRVLPLVDVVIWTFHAGDRAMAPMQNALVDLRNSLGKPFVDKLMISINKVDAIAPGEPAWNTQFNIPSPEQKKNIDDFEDYVREKVRKVLPEWNGEIVSYSARRRFRLDSLLTAMMDLVPNNRKWLYGRCADVADYKELISPEILEYLNSMQKNQRRE